MMNEDVAFSDKKCQKCHVRFTLTVRKHVCKVCFFNFCDKCSRKQVNRPNVDKFGTTVRACDNCYTCFYLPNIESNDQGEIEQDTELAVALRLSMKEEARRLDKERLDQNSQLIDLTFTSTAFPTYTQDKDRVAIIPPFSVEANDDEIERAKQLSLAEEKLWLEKEREYERQLEMAKVISVLKVNVDQNSEQSASAPPAWSVLRHEADECMTCHREVPNTIFEPCGHSAVCQRCATYHWNVGPGGLKLLCPVCTIEVQNILEKA